MDDVAGWDEDASSRALGVVTDEGRGSLPYALLHGESLVACAAWALGEAGVDLLDAGTPWEEIVGSGRPLVLHDPLCPATPAPFVAACVERCLAEDRVVVGVRPVTDTVKTRVGEGLGGTVDRDGLRLVVSPLVLPRGTLSGLPALPTTDLADLAALLAARGDVVWAAAPAEARRVADEEELRVLEALTAGARPWPGPPGR